MVTIEERAYNAFCGTTSCRPDNKIYRFCKNCQHDSRKDAYIKGATEQQRIDIEKACDFMRDFTLPNGVAPLCDYTGNLRKAMEE